MHVLGVVGPSDSGKTTLIERLLPRLVERGRVATVKSIHHDVEVDEPGKDTHRHRAAGAEATVGVTPTRTFGFIERERTSDGGSEGGKSETLAPLLDAFADRGIDYAIVEGFSGASIPKVALGARGGRDVAEPAIAHVDGGATANLDEVVAAIEPLRPYETSRSALDREHGTGSSRATTVASLAAEGLASPADWTHDRIDGPLAATVESARAVSGVERATLDLRPPVTPGGVAAVHLAVEAADRQVAFVAATEAFERFVAESGIDSPVEYLIRED